MYLDRVELIGFLGSAAEAKHTQNGKAVTNLSLATKTSFLKDGERTERTEWHRIQTWGKLAGYTAAFQEGRADPSGRRTPQPRVRNRRHKGPHLRDRRQFNPESTPRPTSRCRCGRLSRCQSSL